MSERITIGPLSIGHDIDLLCDAVDVVAKRDLVSPAILQRRLRVGFAKAGRLQDLLEAHGVTRRADGTRLGRGWVSLVAEADAPEVKARLREIAAAEAAT